MTVLLVESHPLRAWKGLSARHQKQQHKSSRLVNSCTEHRRRQTPATEPTESPTPIPAPPPPSCRIIMRGGRHVHNCSIMADVSTTMCVMVGGRRSEPMKMAGSIRGTPPPSAAD
ncbi:unnamed protein product [Nippostrongylus brasiliensis]|uniref:Uncharacterized protein n=1 Tax=Nippostrongylus brasiliensis TaxID=27835 RepID=A0A0N4XQ47_NIPBR|nr:unnamed protein product [Nippostrongylus brasiliensis]